jgi:hypothetical protein
VLSRRRWLRRLRSAFRTDGTPREDGFAVLRAYIDTKEPGTPRRAMVTAGDFSFFPLLGPALEAEVGRLNLRLVNSYSGHGLSIGATATRGGNGEPLERAV